MNPLIFSLILVALPLYSQTIAEKKAALSESKGDLDQDSERFLLEVNRELIDAEEALRKEYKLAYEIYQRDGKNGNYEEILQNIRDLRATIIALEESWRVMASQTANVEPYALWHQPETTLEQLVTDYGSQDYVYLIPADIGAIKLSLGSNLPIPRSSWNEMLESILTQNGVGIRQLTPFLRELYLFQDDHSGIKLITSNRADLSALPPRSRVAFVLTPDPAEVRRTYFFLDNFINHQSSTVQLVGRDILLIADVAEVLDLLKLADFVYTSKGDMEYKAIPLGKIDPEEMIKIITAIFSPSEESRPGRNEKEVLPTDANGLKVIKLGGGIKGVFLVGTKEEVRKAEQIIGEVEGQIGGAREKTIFWYDVKYSDPNELADVLYKVYNLMIASNLGSNDSAQMPKPSELALMAQQATQEAVIERARADEAAKIAARQIANDTLPPQLYPTDSYYEGGFPISPAPVRPANPNTPKRENNRTNFIVDEKTSAIVMVVEADILQSLKDLIKRLDVPKKMVQLEVLLLEKRDRRDTNYGLDLLRLGTCASNKNKNCLLYNNVFDGLPEVFDEFAQPAVGIFDFILSRKKTSHFPAFDLIYRFLLTQEDLSINSNPSVVTVNQTPAFISIQEEQSINTGVFQVETANGVTLEDAFKRAQYGVTIKITPTIHFHDDEDIEPYDSITLVSDVTFDTVQSNVNDRPIVIRRNIQNEARVADGETVILGGLRRKDTRDVKAGIPFLGEIPGIGKLFSNTTLADEASEMYIFITPKIIRDPACELEWIRQEEMCRRAGDIPEFAACLAEAQEADKNRCFQQWMRILFGRDEDNLYTPGWHNEDTCGSSRGGVYDGR